MSSQRHRIEPGHSMVWPSAWLAGIVACALVVSVFLTLESRAKDAQAEGRQDPIEQLAAKLGDESFSVREQAMDDLWKLGQKALPALRQIEASDDIEASERAKELILYISAGLLFDSPEEVKEIVLGFFQSNDDGKIIRTHNLLKLGEWKQVMFLVRLEKNAQLRNKMAKYTWSKIRPIMLRAIAESNQERVDEILALFVDIEFFMPIRAFYHCNTGTLQEQLEQARLSEEDNVATWKMWLHRASGNTEAAINEAQKAGKPEVADLLRVLTGDAKPWLERSANAGDFISQWGAQLQQLRLQGREDEAADLSQQWRQIVANRPVVDPVIRCLAANGFRDDALSLLQNSDADAAFAFYNIYEMPKHSLKLLGIEENAKPPYTQWVNERVKNLEGKNDDDESIEQLMKLSGFLYERGEYDHARDVLAGMMKLFASQKQDDEGHSAWEERVTDMLAYGQGTLAVHFAKERISQNELEDADIFEIAKTLLSIWSPSPEHLDCLWAQLKKRNAEDIAQTYDELGLLAGLLPDPQDRVSKIHDELMKEAGNQEDRLKQRMITMLFQLCLQRNDITKASLMLDSHAALIENSAANQMDINYELMRWERIEPALEAAVEQNPYDSTGWMKWHIALSKLGKAKQAEEVFKRALLQTLGEPRSLIVLGYHLLDAGFPERAVELWFLAAAMSYLDGADNEGVRNHLNVNAFGDYNRAVMTLANYGQALFRSNDWERAAAISEVYARSIMSRESPVGLHTCLRARYQAEFCQGMLMLQQGKRSEGLRRLKTAQHMVKGSGVLADDFFPAIRNKIPAEAYDRWFDENYSHIQGACEEFPNSHNAHNTAAWLAARAVKNLDEAHAHAQKAVSMRPSQGAYLDTMAEVWFARGERNKAMEWSKKAIAASISNAQGSPRSLAMVYANFRELNKQYDHFKNDPLPNKAR